MDMILKNTLYRLNECSERYNTSKDFEKMRLENLAWCVRPEKITKVCRTEYWAFFGMLSFDTEGRLKSLEEYKRCIRDYRK